MSIFTLEKKLCALGQFLDTTVFKSRSIFHFFCLFFDETTKCTSFLLFHSVGYPILLVSLGFSIHFYFDVISEFLLKIKVFGFSEIYPIFSLLPFGFKLFCFLFIGFYQVIMINTVLAYSPKIRFFMREKYNDVDILKKRHYNAGYSTALKSILPAVTAVCIFCGKDALEAYKLTTAIDAWKDVSMETIKAGLPASECPVNIVVHTSSTSTTGIDVGNK